MEEDLLDEGEELAVEQGLLRRVAVVGMDGAVVEVLEDIVTVLPPRNGIILYSRAHIPELIAIGVVASLSAAKLLEGQVALHTMTAAYGF